MPPKRAKRKAAAIGISSEPEDSPPLKQAKLTAPKAGLKQFIVPVDESFQGEGTDPKVHIGHDGVVYDASLNKTNISGNNNKFYRTQVVEAHSGGRKVYWCVTRWGRVGAFGQSKLFSSDDVERMVQEFMSKFQAKTGLLWENRDQEPKRGKYTFLERQYEEVSELSDNDHLEGEEPKSNLGPEIQSLLKLIFDQTSFDVTLEAIGYDSRKLPLGKLAKSTLSKAFNYLKRLEACIQGDAGSDDESEYEGDLEAAIEDLSNKYYSMIPHISVGRQRLPLINDLEMVKKENDMLDTLERTETSNEIVENARKQRQKQQIHAKMTLLDQHLAGLNLDEIMPLSPDSTESQTLVKYLVNTAGYTHSMSYKVQDIFRIRRHGEWDRFEQFSSKRSGKNSCRRLLWHGSRTTNFGGILSQGLRIAPPQAPVSGYMFDKGIYLADVSTKSANYCFNYSGEPGLLLLCEAELGAPTLRLKVADYEAGEKAKKKGYIATQGIGSTCPSSWVDAEIIHPSLKGVLMPDPDKKPETQDHPDSQLLYNEYIAYDEAQVRLRYLIRFEKAQS